MKKRNFLFHVFFCFFILIVIKTPISISEESEISFFNSKQDLVIKEFSRTQERISTKYIILNKSDETNVVANQHSNHFALASTNSIKPGYKDPDTAFMLSFIPPILIPLQGLGQFYIGKTGDGFLYMLSGITSAALLYRGLQKEVKYGYDDYGNYYEEEKYASRKDAAIGALVYIGGWLYSSFQAKTGAIEYNKSINVTNNQEGALLLTISHAF